ncbi:hypothetical protein [Phenylobacterium sp.]|uniref:hypothetical protein n=1 Tax=Phenylobacterium sp. TaxID=1871053 RepID=UPI0025D19942|nr:hypothetical protein [Phenylobacterium sp.]
MIGAPGSTIWLLDHELRLAFRRLRPNRRRGRWAGVILSVIAPVFLTFGLGVPLGLFLRRVPVVVTPVVAAVAAVAAVMLFTLMLSQTLSAAVDALYQRGDMDLLFSSPLQPRRVMTVRFLGVAATVFSIFAYLAAGPLVVLAVMGHPRWLALLVVLFALALGAAGVGLMLASALFRLLGPRRTRTVAQVMAALIGAVFFLTAQLRNILGGGGSQSLWSTVVRLAHEPRFQVPGLSWPIRAAMGEPLPLLAMIAAGCALFGVANAWLGPGFAADAAAAAGAGRRGPARTRASAGPFAAGPFAVTLRKELRLLARDPALIAQVLLRVLYMIPLGVVLLRQAGQGDAVLVPGSAGALSLLAGQVAGSLAWITVSAEDAPELLASAPAPAALVRRGKLAAVGLPLAILLAPFLLPLIVLNPPAGLAATTGCAASVSMAALLNVWWQRPGKRSDFRTRRRASWFVTWAEFALGLLIAGATVLFAFGQPWGLIPAALAGLGVLAMRRSDARIAEALGGAG